MRTILIAAAFLSIIGAFAQESDSTKTSEKQILTDTIPKPSNEVESRDEPRIIYYQSTSNDRRKRKRRQDIKTLSGSMSHSGGFGAISFRTTDFRNQAMVLAGLRGGWIINRTLGIGVEGHGIIPTVNFDDLDPEAGQEVGALGGYGGMFLELIFFSNEVVHVTFPVSGGAGWIGYNRNDDILQFPLEREIDSDVFWYVEPGANLEFNISRNFRLALGVSKRFTQDLELFNTDEDAFDNLNYFLTLKVGGF
ncbi:MAG: hypothetical protein AAFY41_05070 [Bacteroidota bacterium]